MGAWTIFVSAVSIVHLVVSLFAGVWAFVVPLFLAVYLVMLFGGVLAGPACGCLCMYTSSHFEI